ncbi:MAG: hypothetical protein M3Y59_10030 [Myxococcota bacterium]|nr:hypothetical protein [Myxococcota bacterium]
MRTGLMVAGLVIAFSSLAACDGQPVDDVLPGGVTLSTATVAQGPPPAPGSGTGGSGMEGTEDTAAQDAISAQSLLWTRSQLGATRPIGH